MLSPKSTNQEAPATAPLDDINTTKDVSMVDVSKAEGENQQPPRRKSTIILTDEIDLDRMNIDNKESDKSNEQGDKMHIDRSLSNLNQQQHSQSSQSEPSQPEQQQQQQQQQQ